MAELLPAAALEDALKGLEPEEFTGPGGLLTQPAGRVIETALGAELTAHLGHPLGGVSSSSNVRNGAMTKTVQTDLGPVQFTMRSQSDRAQEFGSGGKMLIDTDENRYLVPDVEALPERDRRLFRRYVYW